MSRARANNEGLALILCTVFISLTLVILSTLAVRLVAQARHVAQAEHSVQALAAAEQAVAMSITELEQGRSGDVRNETVSVTVEVRPPNLKVIHAVTNVGTVTRTLEVVVREEAGSYSRITWREMPPNTMSLPEGEGSDAAIQH